MVFFFALAAKEVFEATLTRRTAGVAAPGAVAARRGGRRHGRARPDLPGAGVHRRARGAESRLGDSLRNRHRVLGDDRARHLSRGHPAIPFLLLLAIADDALGLMILAVFYPSGPLVRHRARDADGGGRAGGALAAAPARPQLLALRASVPASLSWAALYFGGFHPALALVPIVPFMPHSARDLGLFDPREELHSRTRSISSSIGGRRPCSSCCCSLDLANAGVPFEQIGPGTYFVLAALLFGKPIGILLFSGAARLAGARLPQGLRPADLVVVGITAAIGFTVSLFFATAAFPEGAPLAETKMGALLSFVAAPLALVASRLLRARATLRLGRSSGTPSAR